MLAGMPRREGEADEGRDRNKDGRSDGSQGRRERHPGLNLSAIKGGVQSAEQQGGLGL